MIRHHAKDAILICSVVDVEMVDEIINSVTNALEGERYTILEVPIHRIIVNEGKIKKD